MTVDRRELQDWYRQAMLRRIDELLELRAPIERGQSTACDDLRDVGQALRGSGRTFGFPELSAAAGRVETTTDANALRRLEGLLVELRRLTADRRDEGRKRFEWLARCGALADDETVDVIGSAEDIDDAWAAVVARSGRDEADLVERVARRFGLRTAELKGRNRAARRLVPEALLSSHRIVPIDEDSDTITIGTAEPVSLPTEIEVERLTSRTPVFSVASPAAIRAVLSTLVDDGVETPRPRGSGEPASTASGSSVDGPMSVLVVDDEPSARLLIRTLLEKRGFSAVEASDGLEALEAMRDHESIGLAIVDLKMPRMDGLELIWELRDARAGSELPVIVVTGEKDEVLETQIMEEGADDYIRKPLDPRLFLARVEATLRRTGHGIEG